MIKIGILGFNLLILLAYQLFLGGELKIIQDFPDEMVAGKSFMVEVTIEKGDRSGFAKWQQHLPKGFTAKPINTGNATFSYKNNEIKLIWMALPQEESFQISYELTTDKAVNGEFDLDGKFSFIEDNERKDVQSTPKKITILQKGSEENNLATASSNTVSKVDSISKANKLANETTLVTNTKQLKISREITYTEDRHYRVTLTIIKADYLNSFGKVEEYVPKNFEVKEIQRKDGTFSYNKSGVMKILWRTLPEANKLTVSYEIVSKQGELDSATIHGVFSYLDGNIDQQAPMEGTPFIHHYTDKRVNKFDSLKQIAEENKPPKLDQTEDKAKPLIINEPQKRIVAEKDEFTQEASDIQNQESINKESSDKQKKSTKSKEDELIEATTNIPSAEVSVNYKVQIAAARKEVGQDYFTKRHHIVEKVEISFYHNWYNYSVGSFPIYKEARNKRNKIWAVDNKINDAFVTAYNAGERISVQEALMVTNQKWYK